MVTIRTKSLKVLKEEIKRNFERIKQYTDSNLLKLNSEKSHFLIVTSAQKKRHQNVRGSVLFGADEVEPSSVERCLGVQVGETICSWNHQIDQGKESVIAKAGRKLHGLMKLTKFLSFKRRLVSGKSIVLSTLLCSCELWGPALTLRQLDLLQAAQNRLTRWICQSGEETSNEENRQTCGLSSIHQTIVFRILSLGLSVLNSGKPTNLYKDLNGIEDTTLRRSTRKKDLVPSKDYFQMKSFKNYFLKYYNMLPNHLRVGEPRKQQKKKQLRLWIKENIQTHPNKSN